MADGNAGYKKERISIDLMSIGDGTAVATGKSGSKGSNKGRGQESDKGGMYKERQGGKRKPAISANNQAGQANNQVGGEKPPPKKKKP